MNHGDGSGMWVPQEPPSWGRLLLPHLGAWSVLAVLTALLTLAYLIAVVRLRRSGGGLAVVPHAGLDRGGGRAVLGHRYRG